MKRVTAAVAALAAAILLLAGCNQISSDEPEPLGNAIQPSSVDPGPTVGLELLADGLTSPVYLVSPDDGSGRLFVVDQAGPIHLITAEGELLEQPFLDLSNRIVDLMPHFDERGVLGLAFHPGYSTNGRFFVYYSAPLREEAPQGFDHTSHISEFRVSSDDPNRADRESERIVLQVDQPQFNHNAGTLAFGPGDGYLYISLGDGGDADDTGLGHVEDWYEANDGGNGQDVEENLLGSILRIDVDAGDPYGIPPGNPLVGQDGLDEHWAYGFRNPYRFTFDPAQEHGMIAADAGQELWEEASVVVEGGNYGWNVKEGTHCFNTDDPHEPREECPNAVGEGHPLEGDELIDPVIEYPNAHLEGGLGHVVVGGHVYRGETLPQLDGRYIFGDWSAEHDQPAGRLFAAKPRKKGMWKMLELEIDDRPGGQLGHYLLGFGQDRAGEVYVLTTDTEGPTGNTGRVYRLTPPGDR